MDIEAEKLVEQNPRDSLILRRQNNLDIKRRHLMVKRREHYDSFLRSFAEEFLAVENANVFDSLSQKEKNALSEICRSRCWFRLIRHTSIFTAFFGSFATMSMIHYPVWLAPFSALLFLYFLSGLFELPVDYIRFIGLHRFLLKNDKDIL